jgi:hypothetical protein
MKHLNPELEKLEQRIAPDLGISLGIGVGVGVVIGGGCCTSATDSCSGSNGSTSYSSHEGCS